MVKEKMSALERVLTVLEGKIPDRVPSFCLGGDFDFVQKFMNSPFALSNEDMDQLDKDRVSYAIPFIHAIIAKFSPPEILPRTGMHQGPSSITSRLMKTE